ncbi:uncharacterized protein TNCT_540361 [Trichonephila clavata]|uniref:Uncharacterized protein n=1 Tax=Trichonephila clavata TaxID=2740835 RepID=A0A8X6H0Q2_TRICU|nr:uncharacterized protein TNCT_540361 [Trichonephila clavata]
MMRKRSGCREAEVCADEETSESYLLLLERSSACLFGGRIQRAELRSRSSLSDWLATASPEPPFANVYPWQPKAPKMNPTHRSRRVKNIPKFQL